MVIFIIQEMIRENQEKMALKKGKRPGKSTDINYLSIPQYCKKYAITHKQVLQLCTDGRCKFFKTPNGNTRILDAVPVDISNEVD